MSSSNYIFSDTARPSHLAFESTCCKLNLEKQPPLRLELRLHCVTFRTHDIFASGVSLNMRVDAMRWAGSGYFVSHPQTCQQVPRHLVLEPFIELHGMLYAVRHTVYAVRHTVEVCCTLCALQSITKPGSRNVQLSAACEAASLR